MPINFTRAYNLTTLRSNYPNAQPHILTIAWSNYTRSHTWHSRDETTLCTVERGKGGRKGDQGHGPSQVLNPLSICIEKNIYFNSNYVIGDSQTTQTHAFVDLVKVIYGVILSTL